MIKYYKIIEDGTEYIIEENSSGDIFWFKNGKRHRESGPACIYRSGIKGYWLDGIHHYNINSDNEWIIKQIIE